VASTQSVAVSVLLGKGDGTFGPYVDYHDADGFGAGTAGTATVEDFNGDGKLDIAVAVPDDNAVSILVGNGNGTFQPYVEYATAAKPTAVVAADFNLDGNVDLAVTAANADPGAVSILLGNGNGTFQNHVDYQTGPYPTFVRVADLNGDGKPDLAVVDANCGGSPCGVGSISILLGMGNGTFQPHTDYGTGSTPSLAIADFNHDGRLDLAIAHQTCVPYVPCGPGAVSVLLGNGDGTFPSTVPISIAPGISGSSGFQWRWQA
jgi:hypothetical protein